MKTIILALLLISLNASAQNSKTDSPNSFIRSAAADSNKVSALNALARECMKTGTPDSAAKHLQSAINLAIKINFQKGLAESYISRGVLNKNQGEYENALSDYFSALKIYDPLKHDMGISSAYGNIANVYSAQTNYSLALQYHLKALKIRERTGDKKGLASSYNNIGNIYETLGNFEKSLGFYMQTLAIVKQQGNELGIANALNNIGNVYYGKGNFKEALSNYIESLKLQQKINNQRGIALGYNNAGIIYGELGQYSKAQEYLLNALKIRQTLNDKSGIIASEEALGSLFIEMKNNTMAIVHLKKGVSLVEETGNKENLKNLYENLSIAYAGLNDYKNALNFQILHSQVKDSMFGEESSKQIAEMQTKYETEKKEKEIELLNKNKILQQTEIEKNKAEVKQKKIQRNAFITGFGLVCVLGLVVFKGYRQKKKANVLLTEQNVKIKHQKKLIEEKNKDILDSINYARRIQAAILPPLRLFQECLPLSFILYKPKDIVAGDFYWLEQRQGKILFAAADCTGHGVPGAMVSVICNNGLNRSVREHGLTEPGKILDKTREIVIQEFEKSDEKVKDGMDISFCTFDAATTRLQYAGANNPLWLIRNKELTELKADKQPIGVYAENKAFTTHNMVLHKGDTIYLFTDGYADQFGGEKGKKFKYAQLKELLISIQEESMDSQKEILNERFDAWRGNLEQVDDVCIVGIKF